MGTTVSIDLAPVAQSLGRPLAQVSRVAELLDAGNTVPFITRYRKDQTGGLDEQQIREIQSRLNRLRMLADRRQVIRRTIQAQGKLTPELEAALEAADTVKRLEDLYLPFKPRKQTLATVARERGLQPLADEILAGAASAAALDQRAADFINPDKQVATHADALLGAGHILAESFSERADVRGRLREIVAKSGKLVTSQAEADPHKGQSFRDYFSYNEELNRVPPHRVLAINRGERAKVLRVRIDSDTPSIEAAVDELLVPPEHPHAEFLRGCARDALARLVLPSLEREFRRELTETAENHALSVFARNLRNLLLQPPVRERRLLAIDPGLKSGCKLAVLDEFGSLLDRAVVHLVGKEDSKVQARQKFLDLIAQHGLSIVAIGNGTGCRETEEVIAGLIAEELKDKQVAYTIVNEAGASVYSTSPLGREEFPEYDATLRSAISIGRRLQDPLSELVKIDPPSMGVGMYQHDMKEKHLQSSLDEVVESCVNYVGVDLNTASPALLRYVSGLNQLTARRLFDHRREHGPFKGREQLKDVSGIGEATFVQAVGFLKISSGENPLDATWIHPESYPSARGLLDRLGFSLSDLADKERTAALSEKANEANPDELAAALAIGPLTLSDMLTQLARPGRDPRADLPPPLFRQGVLKLEDLTPGMELRGTVLNVVDFGAFVDIGLKDSGLVHISRLADKYIQNPHQVVSVGDIVRVWVMGVDKERRRVSLSMIAPGSERRPPAKQGEQQDGQRRRPEGRRPRRPPRSGQGGVRPATQQTTGDAAPATADGAAATATHPPSNRPRSRPPDRRPPDRRPPDRRPPKPKRPLVPITDAMKKGKEPLRTFGDLLQFMEQKPPAEREEGSREREEGKE